MATKKSAPAAQPVVEPVATETPAAQSVRDYLHSMVDSLYDDATPAVSWKRSALGLVVGVVMAMGTGYATGYICTALAVGAVLLTGSMFVFYLIWILGMLLAMYLGGKVSMFGYTKIVDKSVDRAWNKVTGWFSSSPEVQHV